jgi:hypothetical protein
MEYAVHGMPQVMGFFDAQGEPIGWRFLGNIDAATGEKFWPPMEFDAIDVWGNKTWCGWTAYELRELWKFWHVN